MMNLDSQKSMMNEELKALALFWLRTTVVFCLFLASLSVLDAFITLFSYWAFLAGRMDPTLHADWFKAFQKIQQSPFIFISMNLYNIIVWNGVIVSSIWLLRYHAWSRKMLKALLGLDMVVTVIHLLWEYRRSELVLSNPGWFIVMNVMQVGAILILSHPRIVDLLDGLSLQRKQAAHSLRNSDL